MNAPRRFSRAFNSVTLSDVAAAARLAYGLPGFLRHPIDPTAAGLELSDWLAHRDQRFLQRVQDAIYARPENPFREMLALAGCLPGDLQRLVAQEGVEGALQALFRAGVYLTVDEFKGRRPTRRGSATIAVSRALMQPPGLAAVGTNHSSGSRGASTLVPFNLARVHTSAKSYCVEFEARGGQNWVKAIWDVPGGAIQQVLRFSAFGMPLSRWFSLVNSATPGLSVRYRLAERALLVGGLLSGVRLPRPEHVPLSDPLPVARWMAEILRRGQVPHLYAFLTPAVRLCQTAAESGIDLTGAQFTVTGETLTQARAAVFARVGARAISRYGTAETTGLGSSCLSPAWSDEQHIHSFRVAIVQAGEAGSSCKLPPDALLVTPLGHEAPFSILNLSTGDQATFHRRDCGCAFERLGWTQHLHGLRSFEKLTAAGMTFLDTDVARVLDEILPARFGGGPTHYQLVEGEEPDGRPSLTLLVHPLVGPVDPAEVRDAFLDAIAGGTGTERIMGQVWRTPGLLRVERQPPRTTVTGKVIHLHRATPPAAVSPPP